jgi:hypothetical protein
LDHLYDIKIEVNCSVNNVKQLTAGNDIDLRFSGNGNITSFTIDEIKPWDVSMIYGD